MDNSDKCGHNFPPKECPYERCGFREALIRIAKLEEKLKLAKSLLWRETDEGPITILDVEQ